MTQCRMCSQRLTRPGRLCRECERELDRARAVADSVDGLAADLVMPDPAAAGPEALGIDTLRSRPAMLVAAFAIGIAIAAAAYFIVGSRGDRDEASVMIGRDLAGITPREVRAPAPARVAAPAAVAVSHRTAGSYDRVLGLADALDRCADATPHARIACEARARAAYCGTAGADRIPQCVTPR